MAKGSHKYSVLQGKEKYCWITGARNVPLEKHHIYFGPGQRKISDKHGFWVYLMPRFHGADKSVTAVHGRDGHELDLRLKRECQRKFEETNTREAFMELIGRSYL